MASGPGLAAKNVWRKNCEGPDSIPGLSGLQRLRASVKCSDKCEVRQAGAGWRMFPHGYNPQPSSWSRFLGAQVQRTGGGGPGWGPASAWLTCFVYPLCFGRARAQLRIPGWGECGKLVALMPEPRGIQVLTETRVGRAVLVVRPATPTTTPLWQVRTRSQRIRLT